VPASNPFTDVSPHDEGAPVNTYTDPTTNASGTSEPVATHVALVVVGALVGVYVLRATGFKFVVAGSVG